MSYGGPTRGTSHPWFKGLCARCITILSEGRIEALHVDERTLRVHYKTASNLKKAADAGCRICSAVEVNFRTIFERSESYSSVLPATLYACTEEGLGFVVRGSQSSLEFPFEVLDEEPKITPEVSEVISQAKKDCWTTPWLVRDNGTTSNIPKSTGDPAVAELAKRWLTVCQEEHNSCGNTNSNFYPKRLIDLSGGKPRLIETGNHSMRGPYATLSHCWGQKEFFTLSSDNLDEMMVSIPLQKLPKSFQDAIVFCSRLGIKYLWIDSLCIIQTRARVNKDWLDHARTMSDIYKNCVVNIAIDWASNPYEGAFVERDPRQLEPCYVLCKDWSDEGRVRGYLVSRPAESMKSIDSLTLATRAWVFQERFLAPRIIHFGTDRIFWECRSISRCESSAKDDYETDNSELFETVGARRGLITIKGKLVPNVYESGLAYQCDFKELMKLYTSRSLTRPEDDRLVAFAAVAHAMEQRSRDRYVAGLFASELPQSLLWTSRCSMENRRLAKRGTPSWSWACLSGGCELKPSPERAMATIHDIDLEFVDDKNRYGQVKSGTILIRGRIAGCSLEEKEASKYRSTDWITVHLNKISPAGVRDDSSGDLQFLPKIGAKSRPPGTVAVPEPERSRLQKPGVMSQWKTKRVKAKIDALDDHEEFRDREKAFLLITWREGLLLASTDTKGVYVRIGRCDFSDVPDERYEDFVQREIKII